jgi:hypothetical protein
MVAAMLEKTSMMITMESQTVLMIAIKEYLVGLLLQDSQETITMVMVVKMPTQKTTMMITTAFSTVPMTVTLQLAI